MSAAIRWADETQRLLGPGITAAVRSGTALSAAMYRLEPGAHVPAHRHPNEEFGQILAGNLRLRVDSETTDLAAGDGFLIPGGVIHEADAGSAGCTLLECYAPPRDPFDGSKPADAPPSPREGDDDDDIRAASGA